MAGSIIAGPPAAVKWGRWEGVLPGGHKLLETHAAAAVSLMLDFIGRTRREDAGAV